MTADHDIVDSPSIAEIAREIFRDTPLAWGNMRDEWGPELGCKVPRVYDAARRIEARLLELGWKRPESNGSSAREDDR